MKESYAFNVIDSVDSTNNYAMAQLHAGMASHGTAWFANIQLAGKGQRGKSWKSGYKQNILLSIMIKPSLIFRVKPFYLSAFTALCCNNFLKHVSAHNFFIKWPNDLYHGDRKAGGILIENTFAGSEWSWAVLGIGININESSLVEGAHRPISLAEITGKVFEPEHLARQLHHFIMEQYDAVTEDSVNDLIENYNDVLYKKNEEVKLRKNFAMFNTTIIKVNESGQLITRDTIERQFNFGGVEWILQP